jgi:hypothetical protein
MIAKTPAKKKSAKKHQLKAVAKTKEETSSKKTCSKRNKMEFDFGTSILKLLN